MEIAAALQAALKKIVLLACIQMFINEFDSNLVWWLMLLYPTFWHYLNWPWPWFKVTQVQEMEVGVLLRLISVVNLNSRVVLFIQYSRYRILLTYDFFFFFFKYIYNIGSHSDIYRPISFKFSMMIKTTKLYSSISVWMTLTFIQGLSCIWNQKL